MKSSHIRRLEVCSKLVKCFSEPGKLNEEKTQNWSLKNEQTKEFANENVKTKVSMNKSEFELEFLTVYWAIFVEAMPQTYPYNLLSRIPLYDARESNWIWGEVFGVNKMWLWLARQFVCISIIAFQLYLPSMSKYCKNLFKRFVFRLGYFFIGKYPKYC